MRPVCCKCNREMPCKQMGVLVKTDSRFNPQYAYSGDLYECRCGTRVVVNFASTGFDISRLTRPELVVADLTKKEIDDSFGQAGDDF